MNHFPNTVSFTRFLSLAGLQLILAGAWTLFIARSQSLHTTTLLAVAVTGIGVALLAAPTFLKKYATNIVAVLGGGFGQLGAVTIPVFLSAFLFLRNPSIDTLKIISPLLVCVWLIGIEALFFFQTSKETKPEQASPNRLAFLAILLAYGILLVPSRVPSLLDGFPWNTPLEFITATLLLPFVFFFGRSFLSKKAVTLLLALLLVFKVALSFFLPQAGLGVHIYFSEEALASNTWERTYESFLAPSYSQVAQLPYRSFLEFPVESINTHGFDKASFWMTMKFNGIISLNENERLILILQGAEQRQIELIDMATGESFEVATAKFADDLDVGTFNDLPYVGNAELKGSLLFTNYGNGRFEPVILNSDGSVDSAYSQIWLSMSALDFPTGAFQFIQNLIALSLLGCILYSLLGGISNSYQQGIVDILDIYLVLTGLSLFYVADIADKPSIHLLFLPMAFVLVLVKLLDFILRSRTYSNKGYLFSLGLPILLMFLALDIPNLQSVVLLPQYQDVSDYQILARNIYVAGDAFLFKSPPWAYKVLYPYVIGLLHILFGQSLSAQFFLNAWSALLSVVLTIELAVYFGLSKRISFAIASLSFLLLMIPVSFIFFFRFGLIEPLAIMTLLLGMYFAKEGKFGAMFAIGLVTGMLRLNFAGAIFTSITFLAPAFVGGFTQAWDSFVNWLRLSWKRWVSYLIAIPLPSLFIAFIYTRVKPGYTLTHEMNDQTSIGSVLMSLASVIVGGDQEFLMNQIKRNPLDLVLITLPILFGLLVALTSLFYRKGIFAKIDLRLSLFLLSMLPVYAVLKPVGYFPRYSWSFLPPALILLGLVLQFTVLRDNKAFQDTK
ncbi:MAG: hypothetical protein HYU84_12355 [Chloroflexi bacterium]|nr:hypothetical protein [Chloroflexota bacterium]MBI3167495.1 hypothetical protein [Chloroflexota bacterium]